MYRFKGRMRSRILPNLKKELSLINKHKHLKILKIILLIYKSLTTFYNEHSRKTNFR